MELPPTDSRLEELSEIVSFSLASEHYAARGRLMKIAIILIDPGGPALGDDECNRLLTSVI